VFDRSGFRVRGELLLALGVTLSLLLSACASTSKQEARDAREGRSAEAGDVVDENGDPKGTSEGGRSGPGGSGPGSQGGTGGDSSADGNDPAAPGPSGGKVRIGVHLSQNGDAASQFGVVRLPATGPGEVKAIVDWVNANGGIGGKKVEHFIHVTDPLNGTFDSQAQAACSDLAEDKKVFAVISRSLSPSDVLPACLAKHGVPLVWELHKVLTRSTTSKFTSYLYRPSYPDGDRLGFVVKGLARDNFFGKSPKVAIVRYDIPDHKFVSEKVFRPALKALGISVADEAAISEARAASDAGSVSAQSSNAVLRFQTAGITHVLFVPTGGALPLLFMAAAESQGFRPAYGLNSLDPPGFLAANHGSTQLGKAMAVAWQPAVDTEEAFDPRSNAGGKKLCHDIVKGAGFSTEQARFAEPYCEGFFFLKAALDRNPKFSPDGLREGVEGIGDSFRSPWVFGTRFGPGRYDGTRVVQNAKYDSGCGCFKYIGKQYSVG
jgi:ABC-type branched-subunit amino acid transport system substrate-binding protein